MRRLFLLAAGLLALGGLAIGQTAFNGSAIETFDGAPLSPLPYEDVDWDVQVHSRDRDSWFELPAIDAQHGQDCSAPPATHPNTSYEGSVFICKDHMMTAINGSAGYAEIMLTPNRLLDFRNGPATVRWDVSSFDQSSRDWWDVWITPYSDNKTLPIGLFLPDLSGPPDRAILAQIGMGQDAAFCPEVFRNGESTIQDVCTWWRGVDSFLQPSATARATWELTVSRTHIKGCLVSVNGGPVDVGDDPLPFCYFNVDIADLGWDVGVVQFGHHSYTPEKDNAGVPQTWHWDNISISPSIPFTMIKADRRYTEGGVVNFEAPAPANAYIRFAGVCRVLIDGVLAPKQGSTPTTESQASYFVPIAEGKQSVNISFAADDWYDEGFGCIAKGFSIWSLSAGSSPPPSPTATSTATPTAVATPTATPTPTVVSATPTATATPSQQYECRTRDQRQTRPVGSTKWTTASDAWSTVTIVNSRAECVGD